MITFHTSLTLTNHKQGLEARIEKSHRAEKKPFRLTRYQWKEWQHDKTSHWSPVCCEALFVTEESAINAAEAFVLGRQNERYRDFEAGEPMKLISVQSKGNRIVRVVDNHDYFDIFGKVMSWWEDAGYTNTLVFARVSCNAELALKAAAEWLEGAEE